jgi:2-phospho-L-lactate guanylyltransferase (CobY/MobA/RfbA family)
MHRATPERSISRGRRRSSPVGAKTRLAPALDPGSRADLAAAMLEDVLAVSALVAFASRTVVTESAAVEALAARAGANTLAVPAEDTNRAAIAAAGDASLAGARSALILVADLPLLQSADLEQLLAEEAEVVIARTDAMPSYSFTKLATKRSKSGRRSAYASAGAT